MRGAAPRAAPLTSVGVFTEQDDGSFALSDSGQLLRDVPAPHAPQ
jgi:hypothetical protein